MNETMERIRERMADYLRDRGIHAVTAWPGGEWTGGDGAVAAVSLRECRAAGSGFADYLGERYDEESRCWQELYGKKLELRLGLDLYAAGEGAEEEIQTAFDRLAQALHGGGPEGLKVRSYSCGETAYDRENRLFRRTVEAECAAYLYAAAEEGGAFLDFEIKGEWEK